MTTTKQRSDGDLVAAARRGDQSAFAAIYDRYADRLHSYCFVMLRDRDDAADATHDAFVKAATRLGQLRDPERLRPWLFAIARNEAHARGRQRARSQPVEDLSEALVSNPDPALGLAQEELKELVWSAVAGLQDRDRELMTLHLVEGLEGDDLATAVGVSTQHLHVLLSRMRDRVEKAMGALLIARLGREECEELDGVLSDWDGRFSLDVRSRVTRHVESCDVCSKRRALLMTPANLLPSVVFIPAPAVLRERTLGSAARPLRLLRLRRRLPGLVAAALVVVLVVAGAATFALGGGGSTSTTAAALPVENTATTETTTTTVTTTMTTAPSPTTIGSTSPTTTTVPTTTTTQLVSPPPSTTAPPPPAALALDGAALDLGSSTPSAVVTLRNVGGVAVDWFGGDDHPAFSMSPSSGTLGPGGSVQITISIDRTGLPEGDLGGTAHFTGEGTTVPLALLASVEVAPVFVRAATSPATVVRDPGPACPPVTATQTTISVIVTDDSGVASVVALWSSGPTPLPPVGGDGYAATFGPFVSPGTITFTIVATDTRGNTLQAPVSVDVVSC
jgi:RNA polymerase sigma factor (sigma-70 family)